MNLLFRSAAAILLLLVFSLVTVLPSSTLMAQEKRRETGTSSSRMVLEFEEVVIEGRIHKPRAFFILPRTQIDTKNLEYNENFLPKISKSVEEKPF